MDIKVKGTSEVFMNLEGDYIVEQNKMPNLSLGLIVNNGYLAGTSENYKIKLGKYREEDMDTDMDDDDKAAYEASLVPADSTARP